jgi:hypothetical protein
MDNPPATTQVVTTTGATYGWPDTPATIGLLFGLAGTVFIAIYILRRIRSSRTKTP